MRGVSKAEQSDKLAPPVGSTQRLRVFRASFTADRNDRLFDDVVYRAMVPYFRDGKSVERTLTYLRNLRSTDGITDGSLYCQSKRTYKYLENTFREFSQPNWASFRWNRNYQNQLQELRDYFSKFSLDVLHFASDADIKTALPKEDTHAGYSFIRTGKKLKGEYMDGIFLEWSRNLKEALNRGSFNTPILPGTRTQASGAIDDLTGEFTHKCKLKTRLVNMVDILTIITELQFSRPFQDVMEHVPWYAGGKSMTDISDTIFDLRSRFRYYVSIDYSAFDQTLSDWLIEDAFSVIKAAFKGMSPEESRQFDLVVHDFIHKELETGYGLISVHKGVPSGSMFTSIIDSICNRLMVGTYLRAIDTKGEMIIMGDDNLLYTSYELDRTKLASYLRHNFGVTTHADKCTYGTNEDNPEFLSRFWRPGGQWRHPNVILSKMLYPERFRNYKSGGTDPYLVIYSYILTYKLGMYELLDVDKFLREHPFRIRDFEKVPRKHLPDSFRYLTYYSKDVGELVSSIAI